MCSVLASKGSGWGGGATETSDYFFGRECSEPQREHMGA